MVSNPRPVIESSHYTMFLNLMEKRGVYIWRFTRYAAGRPSFEIFVILACSKNLNIARDGVDLKSRPTQALLKLQV